MPTKRKIQQVAEIEDRLNRCTIAVTTRNNGINVDQVNELRKKLRQASVEYLVVKNNLAAIAADNVGKPGLRDILQGPTAIAFGYGEVVDPPKTLNDEIKAGNLPIELIGAVTADQVLTADQVKELAGLPSKPVLMAGLMGSLMGPLHGLSHALNYHIAGLARALDQVRQQLESNGSELGQEKSALDPKDEPAQAPQEGASNTETPVLPASEPPTQVVTEQKDEVSDADPAEEPTSIETDEQPNEASAASGQDAPETEAKE